MQERNWLTWNEHGCTSVLSELITNFHHFPLASAKNNSSLRALQESLMAGMVWANGTFQSDTWYHVIPCGIHKLYLTTLKQQSPQSKLWVQPSCITSCLQPHWPYHRNMKLIERMEQLMWEMNRIDTLMRSDMCGSGITDSVSSLYWWIACTLYLQHTPTSLQTNHT